MRPIRRIVTLTLNPSIDRVLQVVGEDEAGVRTRLVAEVAGGKGNNVARALAQMGEHPMAVTLAGGWNGARLLELLEQDGVACTALPTEWPVRFHTTVLREHGDRLYLHETGGGASKQSAERLEEDIVVWVRNQCSADDLVLLSGSVPEGLSATLYRDLIRRLPTIRFGVDTSGDALRYAVEAFPYLVKVNQDELMEATVTSEISAALAVVRNRVAWGAIATQGARGAVAVSGGTAYQADPLEVAVVSTLGAGDAFMAGVAYGLLRAPGDPGEVLRWGQAAAAASLGLPAAGQLNREAVNPLHDCVQVSLQEGMPR